jgi:predicted CopG family antitoxin
MSKETKLITISINVELYKKIKEAAEKEDRSTSSYIAQLCKQKLNEKSA